MDRNFDSLPLKKNPIKGFKFYYLTVIWLCLNITILKSEKELVSVRNDQNKEHFNRHTDESQRNFMYSIPAQETEMRTEKYPSLMTCDFKNLWMRIERERNELCKVL